MKFWNIITLCSYRKIIKFNNCSNALCSMGISGEFMDNYKFIKHFPANIVIHYDMPKVFNLLQKTVCRIFSQIMALTL